jgi:interferon-induced transmembrane protein/zinc ribbon protein
MFCSQCGANNAEGALICAQCGRNLQAPAIPLQTTGVVLPPGQTVPNYLVFAILATACCCLPAGISAIVYASQVNSKLQTGDLAGAQAASNNAKMWCLDLAGARTRGDSAVRDGGHPTNDERNSWELECATGRYIRGRTGCF